MSRVKRATAVVVGMAAALAAGSAFAQASPSVVDGGDTFNVAPGTPVAGSSAMVVIVLPTTSFGMMKITCTSSIFAGKTGATLRFSIGLPSFSAATGGPCSDYLGFTDSFQSNTTNGPWTVTEKDFANNGAGDEALPEPNATGDKLLITIPKAGLVDTNNWPCGIVFAPTAAAVIAGAYNDGGTFKITNAKIPVSVSGPAFCGPKSQTVTFTATYKLTPGFFDHG
jgi:hypothetical protein